MFAVAIRFVVRRKHTCYKIHIFEEHCRSASWSVLGDAAGSVERERETRTLIRAKHAPRQSLEFQKHVEICFPFIPAKRLALLSNF